MAKKNQEPDRQISAISISPKGRIHIGFASITIIPPAEGEEESSVETDEHGITTMRKPHKDLIDAFKKLRTHALDICEMNISGKNVGSTYNVTGFKIAGDLLLKQSRVIMTVTHNVKRTGKHIKWATPQITMYGESEYEKAEEMSKLIEGVIEEAWLFLGGKAEKESQLPLFPQISLEVV